jgi:hypothetical protein
MPPAPAEAEAESPCPDPCPENSIQVMTCLIPLPMPREMDRFTVIALIQPRIHLRQSLLTCPSVVVKRPLARTGNHADLSRPLL